jgi:hypothetical protein
MVKLPLAPREVIIMFPFASKGAAGTKFSVNNDEIDLDAFVLVLNEVSVH